jgi:hypothetical protein
MRAFLLAIPLMTCGRGVHTPEGGGKPVRQRIIRAEKEDRRGEPTVAEAPDPAPPPAKTAPPAEPPPRVAARPPVKRAPPRAEPPRVEPPRIEPPRIEPPPVRRQPARIAKRPDPPRPSPDLCGEVTPGLAEPKPMTDEERRPFTDTVGKNIDEIRACYEEARVRAHVDGCMFAVVTVDSLGQLREPYIDTSNIEDVQMQDCVTDAIGAMDLRAPTDDIVWFVLYPFFFEDGEIFHSSQHLRAG